MLGVLYQVGKGVDKDAKRAVALFEKACSSSPRSDAAVGCYALGSAYLFGRGVPKNVDRAVGYIEKSCEWGSASGCARWGQKQEADGDYRSAVTYYRTACDSREGEGCARLGSLYAVGTGVGEDKEQAATLLRRSCDLGYRPGCKALQDLQRLESTSAPSEEPLTCEPCTPQCSYEADAIRATNPKRARALAQRACPSDCSPGTALLMWCHGEGLLLEQRPERHN